MRRWSANVELGVVFGMQFVSNRCNPSNLMCIQVYVLTVHTANRKDGCPYVHNVCQLKCIQPLLKRKTSFTHCPVVKAHYRVFVWFGSTFVHVLASRQHYNGLPHQYSHLQMATTASLRGLATMRSPRPLSRFPCVGEYYECSTTNCCENGRNVCYFTTNATSRKQKAFKLTKGPMA